MPCPHLVASKIIGTTFLGLLSGSYLTYSSIIIPHIKSFSASLSINDTKSYLQKLFCKSGKIFGILSSVSFITLFGAFATASKQGRHPYLIYSSLSVPLIASFGFLKILPLVKTISSQDSAIRSVKPKPTKKTEKVKIEERSTLDNSVYQTLGSDHEDDAHPTTSNTSDEVTIGEAEEVLAKQIIGQNLNSLQNYFYFTTGVSSIATVIAVIGLYGDFA